MRWMMMAIALVIQVAPLPPAYPRPGTTKLFENARVQVWDITWLKQTYPLHRHVYDLTGVYYTDGDRTIVSERNSPSARRPFPTARGNVPCVRAGLSSTEICLGGSSRSPYTINDSGIDSGRMHAACQITAGSRRSSVATAATTAAASS